MSDIVDLLRKAGCWAAFRLDPTGPGPETCRRAADEIERLRAVERLLREQKALIQAEEERLLAKIKDLEESLRWYTSPAQNGY